jgi:hypothetical protein
MISPEQLAEDLYTTYCENVGGVAFNGDPLPTWEEFKANPEKEKQVNAWVAMAVRAIMVCT